MPWVLKTRKEAIQIKRKKSNRLSKLAQDLGLLLPLDIAFKLKATKSAHARQPLLEHYSGVRQAKVWLSQTKMSPFWYGSCNTESMCASVAS